jgi:hypothetical protein
VADAVAALDDDGLAGVDVLAAALVGDAEPVAAELVDLDVGFLALRRRDSLELPGVRPAEERQPQVGAATQVRAVDRVDDRDHIAPGAVAAEDEEPQQEGHCNDRAEPGRDRQHEPVALEDAVARRDGVRQRRGRARPAVVRRGRPADIGRAVLQPADLGLRVGRRLDLRGRGPRLATVRRALVEE